MAKNHYIVLGIGRGADQKQIKKAYRRIAKKYHPDTACPEADSNKFIELREAYETLSDEQKRKAYDRELNRQGDAIRISAAPGAKHNRTAGFHEPPGLSGFMDDFFEYFFTGPGTRWGFSRPGADIYLEAILTPEEARQGGQFHVTIPVKVACPRCARASRWAQFRCPLCSGSGQVQIEKQFELRIPARVRNGALIRFFLDESYGRAAQVYILVRIEPD